MTAPPPGPWNPGSPPQPWAPPPQPQHQPYYPAPQPHLIQHTPYAPGPYPGQPQLPYGPGPVPPPRPRSRRGLWITLAVLAVLAGGTGIAAATGAFTYTVFDRQAMERDVATILRDKYAIPEVGTVTCPADQPIDQGHEFSCEVKIGSKTGRVPITVGINRQYQVGMPS